jgi:hypothetical protein
MPTEPQDRRRKKAKSDPTFSFDLDGETYTFDKPTSDVITTGWLRKNRHRNEEDQFFTAIEGLASEDVLEVIDDLEPKEFRRLYKEFFEHLGADRGE